MTSPDLRADIELALKYSPREFAKAVTPILDKLLEIPRDLRDAVNDGGGWARVETLTRLPCFRNMHPIVLHGAADALGYQWVGNPDPEYRYRPTQWGGVIARLSA